MNRIVLSAIAVLISSMGIFQVTLAMGGGTVTVQDAAAVAALAAAAVAATVFAFTAAAVVATAAFVVAATTTAAFVVVATFFAVVATVAVARDERVPFKWAIAVYGIEVIGAFGGLLLPLAFALTAVGAGVVSILGVWWLYIRHQSQVATV